MAYLYCRACNGDGLVTVIYCNHEQKTLTRSLRCCSLCNMHDPIGGSPVILVAVTEKEVEELLSVGYQFPEQIVERKVV